ncbi:unnamed protein product [Ilex paraguariensis]|uniref:Uncharacterized protein n=1 Tax=Ilex paraguariensis TaxID=185542 RepID=A0ABC8RS41_9AQUA
MSGCFKVKQCGVRIVYNNLEDTPTEEEMIQQSPCSVYQNFFDGDLSAYKMSTGTFLLSNHECFFDQRCSGLTDDEDEQDEDELE